MGFDFHLPFNKGAPLIFTGDGRMWIDYNFGIGKVQTGASSPDLINFNATGIQVLGFNGVNITEEVSVAEELNHNWAEGTIILPHVHWYPTTTGAGSVVWQMEFTFVAPSDPTGGATSTTISAAQVGGGVAWGNKFINLPTITTTDLVIGTPMHVRFFRDPGAGGDDYGADAALATFGLHVLIDSLGSREVLVK